MEDVLIVGGGVAGLVSGWQLARQGRAVTIVERAEPGAGASTAAAGMLAAVAEAHFGEDAVTRMALDSQAMWPDFAASLERESGLEVDYREEPTLILALDRDDLEALARMHRHYERLGLRAEMLTAAQVSEREPALSPNVQAGVLCPGDHQVDPPRLVAALVAAFEAAGGTMRPHTHVTAVVEDAGVARGVSTADGETIEASAVVIATGAWTRQLDGLGDDVPHVRPVRGQMLAIALGDPPLLDHVVRAPDAYLAPKSSGRLVVGATMEEVGFDAALTAGGVFELLRGAWRAVPGIYDQALLDTWTGFRPMTLDNEPIIRASTSLERLWFVTGHGRNGILLTPWTGRRALELLSDG